MSSSYKTPCLGLNRFVGTDKPKMDDFNYDNQAIDSNFQEHIASNLHITAEERQMLGKAGYVIGSYTGNDAVTRSISLGFAVEFGLLFAVGEPLSHSSAAGPNNIYSAMLAQNGCSKGISLEGDGFKVLNHSTNPPDGKKCQLNVNGKTYVYLVFPKKV